MSSIHQGEFESKGSKFLSFLLPIDSFDSQLSLLRNKHPKAVHFVYAARVLKTQILESFSDDGEPKGSSGMPALNVLRGENLINTAVIVVRYFGGTLLGVGGLVRAYTQATQEAIKQAKNSNDFLEYEHLICYEFEISYPLFTQVKYWIDQLQIKILRQDFQAQNIKLLLSSTKQKQQEFYQRCQAKFGFTKT